MKIVRSFSASIPEATAIERVTGFLTQSGYRQLPVSGHILKFKRVPYSALFSILIPNAGPALQISALHMRITRQYLRGNRNGN